MELDIKKINDVMLDNGIMQKDLAKNSEIQESTLSKILNGKVSKPNRKTIFSIAKGLNLKPSDIVKEVQADE
ncbi:helix-turn-helix domain-containing protein [Clostridium butyricum]|uniref:helix-turn-helix domain-containing protein n=1 Tax=Clostridium butyricum TaxID=1492 RepID=UPI0018A0AD65|nr:helix-turn-helix transcriptional regulator [Clostridium butyricum]MDB2150568.1 helix-turn-helix transcriptional regulator [Clostridium butyricum]